MYPFRNYLSIRFLGIFITAVLLASCSPKQKVTGRKYHSIEEKYAAQLGVKKENISNVKLYLFIDSWYGSPYKYGGKTRKGVDCSGFTSILYREIFGMEISGSSSAIYKQSKPINKDELKEGDLVFFKIDSKEISHVGIYLQNNKFVHATTKAGVMIDGLDEDYYKKYYEGCARIIAPPQ